jgi:hypothetical protein
MVNVDSRLVTCVGQQRHKARPFHRIGQRMLTDRRASRFAPSDEPTMSVDQFFEQLDIFIVDIHRSRTLAINVKRILADGFDFEFRFLSDEFFLEFWQGNNP